VSAKTKPTSAPVLSSKPAAKAKVNVPFAFTVKTKANPVASITESGPLPIGVTFNDNHNGTATLSGTAPLAGSYAFALQATNGISPPASQALTLTVKSKLPLIRHVFVIMLENNGYSATFGSPASDPYLATTLPSQGALLPNYYGIGHFSNDNYAGFISGQPPNSDNQLDCLSSKYVDFPPSAGQDGNGIQQGAGCVYPAAVKTVADQLTGEGLTWKGYMEDMGNNPAREAANCGHPTLGSSDPTAAAGPGDGYAARHDPFVYFHSTIDNTAGCNQAVVPLGTTAGALPAGVQPGTTGLVTDLASVATTPNLSFLSPNLCNDGHDYPCTNQPSPSTSSVSDTDAWLKTWVPIITSSPAFQKDGLLLITFDEGEQPTLDTTACCGETPGPAASSGGNGLSGPGGGRVGAVLLSPFINAGTLVKKTSFNHYSALASIEDLFGLPRLAEAKTVMTTFDKGVYIK
jgi:hypothetical protein